MKKLFFLIIFIVIVIIFIFWPKLFSGQKTVKIGSQTFIVEIADQEAEQRLGLANRPKLANDQGMLFVYPDKKIRSFWMKNMNFGLDIIWLVDETIVQIDKNLEPERDNPQKIYTSRQPVNYVLEINAGLADRYNFQVGQKVIYNF